MGMMAFIVDSSNQQPALGKEEARGREDNGALGEMEASLIVGWKASHNFG